MKKVLSIVCLIALTVCCLFSFASCGAPNSDPSKALASLKENGVTWAAEDKYVIPTALKLLGVDGIDSVVSGTGKIDDEYAHVTIIYFEESEDAKEAWETVKEYAEENKSNDAEDSEWVCDKSGKMIWYGTKNAIKAAK